jgi:hypothetical protein
MTDSAPTPASTPTPTPVADVSRAPLPTEKTLRMRRNLPYQATRFAVFNLRIMRMVRKAHHH